MLLFRIARRNQPCRPRGSVDAASRERLSAGLGTDFCFRLISRVSPHTRSARAIRNAGLPLWPGRAVCRTPVRLPLLVCLMGGRCEFAGRACLTVHAMRVPKPPMALGVAGVRSTSLVAVLARPPNLSGSDVTSEHLSPVFAGVRDLS